MGNCESVEETVQNLRTIEDRQVSAVFAKKAEVFDCNNSPDFPVAKTPGKEKYLLFFPPIIVSDRQEHFEFVKGYLSVPSGNSRPGNPSLNLISSKEEYRDRKRTGSISLKLVETEKNRIGINKETGKGITSPLTLLIKE